jgi:hypothetical protein
MKRPRGGLQRSGDSHLPSDGTFRRLNRHHDCGGPVPA